MGLCPFNVLGPFKDYFVLRSQFRVSVLPGVINCFILLIDLLYYCVSAGRPLREPRRSLWCLSHILLTLVCLLRLEVVPVDERLRLLTSLLHIFRCQRERWLLKVEGLVIHWLHLLKEWFLLDDGRAISQLKTIFVLARILRRGILVNHLPSLLEWVVRPK